MATGVSRRTVLAGGGLLAFTAAGGGAFALVLRPAAEGALVLSAGELDIVAAVAEVMFPGVHFHVGGIEAGVPAEVDRIVADLLDPVRSCAFRYLLRTLEWGTMASRGTRFTHLPVAERSDVLATWSGPRVMPRRVARDLLKVVLGMAYFDHPAVRAAMGWRATCGGGPV